MPKFHSTYSKNKLHDIYASYKQDAQMHQFFFFFYQEHNNINQKERLQVGQYNRRATLNLPLTQQPRQLAWNLFLQIEKTKQTKATNTNSSVFIQWKSAI